MSSSSPFWTAIHLVVFLPTTSTTSSSISTTSSSTSLFTATSSPLVLFPGSLSGNWLALFRSKPFYKQKAKGKKAKNKQRKEKRRRYISHFFSSITLKLQLKVYLWLKQIILKCAGNLGRFLSPFYLEVLSWSSNPDNFGCTAYNEQSLSIQPKFQEQI